MRFSSKHIREILFSTKNQFLYLVQWVGCEQSWDSFLGRDSDRDPHYDWMDMGCECNGLSRFSYFFATVAP